jgi:hypothetical protein
LSPEQIRCERLDGRTDLFSFGLVLYELVTGQRAFSGETATAIRNAVVNVLAAPIRKLNPDVPVELETIIGKALEKDRGRRYQSAREMRADLERLRASLKPRSPALRIIVGAAAVLLAGIAWGIYTTFPERPPFQKIEMMQLTNQGRVQVAAISPDGKYVAYAVDEIGEAPRWDITGGQSKESLWIRQVNGGDLQAIPPLEARYGGMVFSADGDFLYFVRVDTDDRRRGRVYKMPVLGGNAQPILSGVELPYGLTLSPDGKRLAFIAESDDEVESRLMVANADGTGIRNSPFARSRQVSSACRGHLQGKRSQHSATTKRRTSPTGCPSR